MAALFLFLFLFSAAVAQGPATGPAGPAAGEPHETDDGGSVSVLSGFMEPFEYDPQGRKDPFAQPMVERPMEQGRFHGPVLPLQKFPLGKLSLVGVIWDVSKPRAMVRDPNGGVHVVGPNAKLGDRNGYVAAIREGELVVVETYEEDGKLFSQVRVVKIADSGASAR